MKGFIGFLKRGMTPAQKETFLELNEALTPETVDDIVSKMGGYVADRHARPGREADLPFPKTVIEMAFLKAIRECTDPVRLGQLKGFYIRLDDYMLTDEDSAILAVYHDFMEQHRSDQTDNPKSFKALAEKLGSPEMQKATQINQRLTEAMRRRLERINKFSRKTEYTYSSRRLA